LPLKTEAHALPLPADHLAPLTSGGKPYLLYIQPILESSGRQVGAVIIPKDMTLERKALEVQDRFNLWVVGIATLVACAIALWLIVQEFLGQTKNVTLEEALRVGESRTIEFKSTFLWDLRRSQYVDERRLDTLKSIAGFLNASGGTLFVGVSEDTTPPSIRGLDEDLKRVGNSKDKLQRSLRDLITTRIGPEFSPFITDSLEEDAGRLYWKIVVEGSPEPAFVRWTFAGESKEQRKFYVREGPKTSDLDNESTWHYIKNKWG
jgi:Putative DNA-binding domain